MLTSDARGQQPGPGQGEAVVADMQLPQQQDVLLPGWTARRSAGMRRRDVRGVGLIAPVGGSERVREPCLCAMELLSLIHI